MKIMYIILLVIVYFGFFKKILMDQGPFCGAIDFPYFGLRVILPMGFKARVVLSLALPLACVRWT